MSVLALMIFSACEQPKHGTEEGSVIIDDTGEGDSDDSGSGIIKPDEREPVIPRDEEDSGTIGDPSDSGSESNGLTKEEILRSCAFPDATVCPIDPDTGAAYGTCLDLHAQSKDSFENALATEFLSSGQEVDRFFNGEYPMTVYSVAQVGEHPSAAWGRLQVTLGDHRGLYAGHSDVFAKGLPREVKLPVLFCQTYGDGEPAQANALDRVVGQIKVDDEGISDKWPGESAFELSVHTYATPASRAMSPIIYAFAAQADGRTESFRCNRVGGTYSDCDLDVPGAALALEHAKNMSTVQALGNETVTYFE